MKRFLISILSLILVVITVMSCSITAFAYCDIPDGMSLEEASKDPRYWRQGRVPEGNFVIGSQGSTVGGAACSWFSASCCLVKMGLMDPKKDNPVELIKWAQEKPDPRIWSGFHIWYEPLSDRYPGLVTEFPNKDLYGVSDFNKVKTWVKGKMNEGWFIAMCVHQNVEGGAHWIAVDGFDKDDNMIIADSAWPSGDKPKLFNEPGSYGRNGAYSDNPISDCALFKYTGADPNKCPSIYGGTFEAKNDGKLTEEEQKEYESICEEGKLKGIELVVPNTVLTTQQQLEFADRKYLSSDNISQIEGIQDLRNSGKITILQVVSVTLNVVGLILLAYSTVLFIALIFDRVNVFVDFSLLSILSLGRLKLNTEKNITDDLRKKGHRSMTTIIFLISLVLILGVLFISGLPLRVIYSIIT